MSAAKEKPALIDVHSLAANVPRASSAVTARHAPGVPYQNADARVFWEAAAEKRLVLQQCVTCRHIRYPPGHICPKCWETGVEWVTSAGRGNVHSFTIVHRAPTPAFQKKVPYVVAIIDLAEGPRMVANIVGLNALETRIGDRVDVTFDHDGIVPQFQRSN